MKLVRGGVEYEDLLLGEGEVAERGCVVTVCYDLFLNRGDRVQDHQQYTFRLGDREAIPGLEYGVEGMRVSGKRLLSVGPHLAYRDKGIPGVVPANAILDFHVTLLAVSSGAPYVEPTT